MEEKAKKEEFKKVIGGCCIQLSDRLSDSGVVTLPVELRIQPADFVREHGWSASVASYIFIFLDVLKMKLNIVWLFFFSYFKIQSVCLSGLILLGFPFCNYVVDIDADGVLLFYPIPQVNPESDGSRLHIMSPLSLGHCTLHLSEWPREKLGFGNLPCHCPVLLSQASNNRNEINWETKSSPT